MGTPYGRFDDFDGLSAFEFTADRGVVVADSLDEVVPALDAVTAATRAGHWAFGFVSYEAASAFDAELVTREPVPGLPLVWFGIASELGDSALITPPSTGLVPAKEWTSEWRKADYVARVDAVKAQIADGNTYQCNLTNRLRTSFDMEPSLYYGMVANAQRSQFGSYLDIGRHVVMSASPELFFDLNGSRLLLRPMKGTAARGASAEADRRAVCELSSSAKERAENVMIVDLLRNDAARIATGGSVRVRRLLHTETYPTVHQLTTDIEARVPTGVTIAELFTALFPSGSITGAPKVSTMRLIADLETSPRGIYCGAIGFVGTTGVGEPHSRFSVAIRTVVGDRLTGVAEYGTGSGVTWSSDAYAEYDELEVKTRILR
ncbi:chorismate-binding protein [Gordonia terrae]|uniref:chorismate-binding protein n=1 Tax=Gordonia hongkongensis TaxID=1701090 RepID=UPI0022B59E09|nr:chorismate-binding protein [Gordonia terrae]